MKKITILAIIMVLALAAGIVGAQDRPRGRQGPGNGLLAEAAKLVQEQTGLTPQEIRQQLAQGKTLEQVITDNGGDVEAVIKGIVDAATERINQAVTDGKLPQARADEMLKNLESTVRTLITGGERADGMRPNAARPLIELTQILLEQAGLEPQQVREGLRSGKTIADLITVAGGNVQAVIDGTVKAATDRINEAVKNGNLEQARADEMLSNLETAVTRLVNGTRNPGGDGMGRPARRLVNAVAEATGLKAEEVIQQVRDGATLASILTGKGISVDSFVNEQLAPVKERLDQAVKNGTISQAVADARLNLRRVELTDALNRTVPVNPATTTTGNA